MSHAREMSDREASARETPPASPASSEDFYLQALAAENAERRGLQRSLLIAAIVHGLLLAVTLPELGPRTLAAEQQPREIYVVKPLRFEKKPPPPERNRQPKSLKVPIPDPDPDEPEIFVADLAPEPDFSALDLDADRVFLVPDPPPLPAADPGPLRVGGEVAPPVRVHYVEPRYTEIARRAGIQGRVILQATIDRAGAVRDVAILEALPFGLDEAAAAAVRRWRFEPSTHQGRPVEVLYVLTVRFELHR